jgi:transposase
MKSIQKVSAGIDVHKKIVVCTILKETEAGIVKKETKSFGFLQKDKLALADWFVKSQVEISVMESTSVYWKSIHRILESAGIKSIIVNARHIRNVPGRKTDVQDSEWLAELARYGLLRASYIPKQDIQEIRLLTRYRKKITGMMISEKNRLHKILDDCGIGLGNVVTRLNSVTASQLIQALIDGKRLSEMDVKQLAKTTLKQKSQLLYESLQSPVSDRHRFVLSQIQAHLVYLNEQLNTLDAQIVTAIAPYEKQWKLLQTIPGIDKIGAALLLAEIGIEYHAFKNKKQFCSWAGVSPGNNESAGKKKAQSHARQIHI